MKLQVLKKNLKVFAAAALMCSSYLGMAQSASSYIFSQDNLAYADLVSPTAFTSWSGSTEGNKLDEGRSNSTAIGFPFKFAGVDRTNFLVTANGVITFNTAFGGSTFDNTLAVAKTAKPALMPLFDDLRNTAFPTYKVEGAVGSRILKIEYSGVRWNANNPITPDGGNALKFQVWLYETSNIIEYRYKQRLGTLENATATIGIIDGNDSFLTLDNSSTTATASSTPFTTNISTKPENGQIFRFSPASPVITTSVTPLTAFVSCVLTPSAVQNFTVSGTNVTANILVAAPSGFEVSTAASGPFSNSLTLNQTSYTVATTTIYARMKALSTSPANANIVISSTGATNKNVAVSGAFGAITTWNNGSWSPAAPTSTNTATINGAYAAPDNITACSLTVNTGAVVTIPSGQSVTLSGALTNNGSFTLENNANLIQSGSTNPNSGTITVKRNSSALKRLDYTLWSSPTGITQLLKSFSPETIETRFYTYNTETNKYAGVNPNATNFQTAKAYLIRMPDGHPTTETIWNGEFVGKPNSGDINFLMENHGAGKRFNAVGNPYPSPILASAFVGNTTNAASITGSLYFWRKTNNSGVPAYYTWSIAGLVAPGTENPVQTTDFIIQTGQGFIVETSQAGGSVAFRNNMRVNNHTNTFYKAANTNDFNRIWLNATNTDGLISQTLVAYFNGGADELDSSDAKYLNDGDISLTSIVEDTSLAIQGKGLPFQASDSVQLQFSAKNAGTYTIAIDHVDGLFEGTQDIFLRDTQTGLDHDLKAGGYTFATEAGTFADRFSVVYQNALGTVDNAINTNSIAIAKNNNTLNISAGSLTINSVVIFDLQGRKIFTRSNVDASTTSISDLTIANQIILVQITTDKGIVTKKVQF